MKADIHPVYFPEATISCSCGNTWVTGSTQESINTDLCYKCHPFYTGEQRIVDTEGQVERFYRKLEARQQHVSESEESTESPKQIASEVMLVEIELTKRALSALSEANISNAEDVVMMLEEGGEEALLAISGFGRKSLIDLKKALRALDVELPGDLDD
ncbi:MAG: 50S ribosomal protein L31 [Anaerolineaceae bacterium]|nr:50S ribosomal protein L31 [Anaerolineaceae bacterium]|tara:strand:+ start:3649 stop:4122 length:474 start_codon:yes stop_codon:yes gene_type:complete